MSAHPGEVCSKGGLDGQWAARVAAVVLLALAATGGGVGCSRHAAPAPVQASRPTPSGLPVPRYVSLKFGKVNARGGPGDDFRLLWVYHVKGLPLQVVAETLDWRRVCGPDGQLAWVHRRTVAERRTVMRVSPQDLTLRRSPSDDAPASATLVGRALADLKTCRDGWCQISAGRAKGWVRPDQVWGLADAAQCRSP